MGNDTTRRRAAILRLRKRINLDEAPYVAMSELDGSYKDVLALLVEAVTENDLPAEVEPRINQWTGEKIGDVDPSRTTIATADLTRWLSNLQLHSEANPPLGQLAAAPEPDASCDGDQGGQKPAARQDDMAIEIGDVVSEMERGGLRVSAASVMTNLKARAGRPESCITEAISEGVMWVRGSRNQPEKLTTANLRDRLKRR